MPVLLPDIQLKWTNTTKHGQCVKTCPPLITQVWMPKWDSLPDSVWHRAQLNLVACWQLRSIDLQLIQKLSVCLRIELILNTTTWIGCYKRNQHHLWTVWNNIAMPTNPNNNVSSVVIFIHWLFNDTAIVKYCIKWFLWICLIGHHTENLAFSLVGHRLTVHWNWKYKS